MVTIMFLVKSSNVQGTILSCKRERVKEENMKRNNFMAIGTDKFRVSVANGDLMITYYDNIVPVIKGVHKGNKYLIDFVKVKEDKQ